MDTLCTDLSVPREALRLGHLDVEGHSTSVVRERLLGALRTMVTEAAVANRAAREAWGRPHDEAAAAQEPTSFWVTLRTPRRIVVESLIAIWSQFLGDCDSHRFRIMQLGLTPVAFYQRVDQAIDQEWRRVRDLLPAKVLANLVAGARLETVNDLFFTVEHQQPESGSPDESFRPPDPIETTPASPPPSPSRVTVLEFLAATSEAAGSDSAKVAEFRRTILDFAKDASTSQLQTPHRILAAMARWSKDESDRGMTAEQRRLHMTWIRDYLKYLRRRGLIAPLPTMAQRAWWHVDGLVQSVMTETSLITLAGLILFVSAFVTATLFGRIPGLVLHGKWVAFDYLLCAGLLQAGALTSVAFPGLLLGRGALLLITPNSAQAPRAVPFERLAVLAVQVALAIWMTPWSGGGADRPAAARAAAVFAGCLLIAVITNSLTWFIDQKAGVAMDGIFLAVGIAVAFVPWLARASAASVAALGVFALAMAATALGPLLNRVSLQLATARIDVSGSVVRSEEVLTTSTISGSIGFPAYLFALLLAISVAGAVGSSRWEGAVLYGVYAATLAGITIRIIATRTNAEYWTSNLNATRSVIVGVDEVTGIEAFLGRLRWVLVGRALALEAVLVGAGLFLIGWNARLATLPATPLVLLAACLLVDAARPSVASLGRLVLGLGRYQAQELNIEDVTAPDEAATLWQRLKKLKGGRLYTVLAFVVFVMQVVPLLLEPFTQKNVLELLKLLKEILK